MSDSTQPTAQGQAPRQRRKSPRFVHLVSPVAEGTVVMALRTVRPRHKDGDLVETYHLESLAAGPSQMPGKALILHGGKGQQYECLLSGPDSSCSCRGFSAWGYCKHLSALLALQQAGKLAA
jgi:hypothetical protein